MKTLMISMVIGVIVGLIDIIPMIVQRLPLSATLSAFLQYFFVSIVIAHISLPGIPWWLQGGLVSFALALPIAIIVDKHAAPIIMMMSLVLGTLISVLSHFLI